MNINYFYLVSLDYKFLNFKNHGYIDYTDSLFKKKFSDLESKVGSLKISILWLSLNNDTNVYRCKKNKQKYRE